MQILRVSELSFLQQDLCKPGVRMFLEEMIGFILKLRLLWSQHKLEKSQSS